MPQAGWDTAPPLRKPAAGLEGTLLGDVDCHLPFGARLEEVTHPDEPHYPPEQRDPQLCHASAQPIRFGHPYGDADRVTWAHEATHGVCGRLRMSSPGWNCFYLYDNTCFWLAEPKFRKRDVIKFIRQRGRNFDLYVAGQTEWDKQPLYLLDEWNAYINGSDAGLDLARQGKWRWGRRHDTLENMTEFCEYARAVAQAQRELDADYPHANQLQGFVWCQQLRAEALLAESQKFPDFAVAI